MNRYDAIEIFAKLAIIFFILSFASFILLFFHKRVMVKYASEKLYYRGYLKCFKAIVKYHKWFGIIAFISMLFHGILVYFNLHFLPPSGVIAGIGLTLTVLLGLVRAFIIKHPNIQRVHFILAILTCFAVSIHYIQFE